MSQQSTKKISAEKAPKLKRHIDMEICVKYQHLESGQSKRYLQALVQFLAEQTLDNEQADNGEG